MSCCAAVNRANCARFTALGITVEQRTKMTTAKLIVREEINSQSVPLFWLPPIERGPTPTPGNARLIFEPPSLYSFHQFIRKRDKFRSRRAKRPSNRAPPYSAASPS
jgi:hypothetical protein